MAGLGGFPFGGGEFGGIGSETPEIADDLLIQPIYQYIGLPVLIAATDGSITDTSKDDDFINGGVGIEILEWAVTLSSATTSVDDGLLVTLNKDAAGAMYQLTSIDEYVSGDISVEYDITSEFLANTPAEELIYIALQMTFTTGETLTIKRKAHNGFNGQSIQVVFINADGAYGGGGTFETETATGKLRLIRHGSIVAAVKDDDTEPMFSSTIDTSAGFNVQIFSDTSGENDYCQVRYRTYISSTGILLGSKPIIDVSMATLSRIVGTVPQNTEVGLVDVVAFNHDGERGRISSGFEYPLVTGQALSRNDGMVATVQLDAAIR